MAMGIRESRILSHDIFRKDRYDHIKWRYHVLAASDLGCLFPNQRR